MIDMALIKLEDYCLSVRDGTHDTPKPKNEGKYLITSKSINNDEIDYSSAYYISENDYEKINKRSKVDKYDVIMTMIGSVGRLHFVDYEPEYAIKNIALFKVGDYYKAKWLYYYLSSNNVQYYLDSVATGTSQHFVGLGYLRKFKIEDFSSAGKKIVDILSKYDNLIKINNKKILLLDTMIEEIYKEWFIRLRFPGYKNTIIEKGIPYGWAIDKVKNCVDRKKFGKTYKSEELETEGDIIVIGQSKGEFLGYHNGDPSHKASIDNPMLLFGDHSCKSQLMITDFSLGENVIPFVTNDENSLNNYYLFYATNKLIETEEYKRHWSRFCGFKILIPPKELQDKFAEIIIPFINNKKILLNKNQNLKKQRDLLLSRLMARKLIIK